MTTTSTHKEHSMNSTQARNERRELARQAVRDAGLCEWFAMCTNDATGTIPHPILGDVPICDRCRGRVN